MTTKGFFRKQIIVLISSENINKFMMPSSEYIVNLNRALETDTLIDFIHIDN